MKFAQFGACSLSFLSLFAVAAAFAFCSIGNARAAFVEGFANGSNDGDWSLGPPVKVKNYGGNPGAYIRGQVDAAVPTWYVPLDTPNTHFIGNLAKEDIGIMSCDMIIFAGIQVPDRNVTLDVETTFGTGDFSQGVDAYYIGTDISKFPVGWTTYAFPLLSASPTIPPGWVVTRGNGDPGNDADWRRLMRDVETLGFELGTPGYAYPFWIWQIGLDNVRITHRTSPPDGIGE